MAAPAILFWDLETAGVNALRADLGAVVCFGYKWLGSSAANCLTIDEFGGLKKLNDRRLLRAGLALMEEADMLVAHYGDKFDRRFFQGRCAIHGLTPPPPTKQRDTCLIARRAFNFSSNRLGHLAHILGVSHQKEKNGWPEWWMRVLAGDRDALKKMAQYCKGDVLALEDVYLKLRPYDHPHPRLYDDREVCGVCNGAIQYRGTAAVGAYKYRRYQCRECGRWGRERQRLAA